MKREFLIVFETIQWHIPKYRPINLVYSYDSALVSFNKNLRINYVDKILGNNLLQYPPHLFSLSLTCCVLCSSSFYMSNKNNKILSNNFCSLGYRCILLKIRSNGKILWYLLFFFVSFYFMRWFRERYGNNVYLSWHISTLCLRANKKRCCSFL